MWSLGYTVMDGNPIIGFTFNGFENFVTLLQRPDGIGTPLCFTLKYAVVLTVLQVALGYGLALLYVFWLRRASGADPHAGLLPRRAADRRRRAAVPAALRGRADSRARSTRSSTPSGIASVDWFGTPAAAFWVIILMDLWRSMGFYAVLLYAGLVDIPDELIESARLDGARGWKLIRHIVLPLSLPVLLSSLIFSINGTLKVFDTVVALTNGGPGQRDHAADALHVPDLVHLRRLRLRQHDRADADDPLPAGHRLHLPVHAARHHEGLTHDRRQPPS